MTCTKKVIVLITIIIFFKVGNCEWKEISESKKGTYYIDFGSVRLVDKDVRSVWVLVNFKEEIQNVKSRQLKLEMDCLAGEMRIKSIYSYSGFFLGGIPIKDYYKTEEWRSIKTDRDLEVIHKQFCKKSN